MSPTRHLRSCAAQCCIRSLCVAVGMTVLCAATASASHQYLSWNEEGRSYQVVGANEAVTIFDGAIEFECDFVLPTADVYFVRSGVLPGQILEDMSGTPNTSQGANGVVR